MAISDYIPNIFGPQETIYQGLLGPQDAAALSQRSNIAGLLGTAAALAAGMGSQGPKRSATQNILAALGAGYGTAGQVYQGGIEQLANAQKLSQMRLEATRAQETQNAINNMLADPSIANDPLAIAYIRSNPADAIKEYAQQKAFQREREATRQSMFGAQPTPAQGAPVEGAALPAQVAQGNSEIAMLEQQIQNAMADAAAYGARRDPVKQEAALRSVEKLRERQGNLLAGEIDIRDRMAKAPEGFKQQYKTIADLKETGVLKGKDLLDAIQKVDTAVQESSKQYRYDGIIGQYAYQMFGTNDATKLSPEQNRNILAFANAPTQADQTKVAIDAQKLQFETGKAPALPKSREQFIQGQVVPAAAGVVPTASVVPTAPEVVPTEVIPQTGPRIRGMLEPMAQPPAPIVAPELQRTGTVQAPQIAPAPQPVQPPVTQPRAVQPQAPKAVQPQAPKVVQPAQPQVQQAPKAKPAVDIGKVTPLVQQPDAKVPPKEKQKLIAAQPATIGLVNYSVTQLVDARDAAQALLNSPKELKAISGMTGPTMAKVPGTDAFTGAQKLENLQTRAFVTEIQKMRQASPTGGAVGSVTEKEMGALSNIQASLKAGLKEDVLKKQLQQYINSANRALKTIPNEYARTYGYNGEFDDILKGGVVQQQPSALPKGVTVKRKGSQ
jgi:hypothetical protein